MRLDAVEESVGVHVDALAVLDGVEVEVSRNEANLHVVELRTSETEYVVADVRADVDEIDERVADNYKRLVIGFAEPMAYLAQSVRDGDAALATAVAEVGATIGGVSARVSDAETLLVSHGELLGAQGRRLDAVDVDIEGLETRMVVAEGVVGNLDELPSDSSSPLYWVVQLFEGLRVPPGGDSTAVLSWVWEALVNAAPAGQATTPLSWVADGFARVDVDLEALTEVADGLADGAEVLALEGRIGALEARVLALESVELGGE